MVPFCDYVWDIARQRLGSLVVAFNKIRSDTEQHALRPGYRQGQAQAQGCGLGADVGNNNKFLFC